VKKTRDILSLIDAINQGHTKTIMSYSNFKE